MESGMEIYLKIYLDLKLEPYFNFNYFTTNYLI